MSIREYVHHSQLVKPVLILTVCVIGASGFNCGFSFAPDFNKLFGVLRSSGCLLYL